jgi:hypothetical protein
MKDGMMIERIKMDCKQSIKKLIERFEVWSLYYRQEILWFIAGFVLGAIIL